MSELGLLDEAVRTVAPWFMANWFPCLVMLLLVGGTWLGFCVLTRGCEDEPAEEDTEDVGDEPQ